MNTIPGTTGNDVLTGTGGADIFEALTGSDDITAGAGDDLIILDGTDGDDIVDGGAGYDTVRLTGNFGQVFGTSPSNDILPFISEFQINDDFGSAMVNLTSVERIEVYNASDELRALFLTGTASADTFDLTTETFEAPGGFWARFARVYSGDGNDVVTANADIQLQAFLGDGNDTFTGSSQNDLAEGGAGADTLDGGLGDGDAVTYGSSDAGVSIDLQAGTASGGHAQGDVLTGFEDLVGSRFADTLLGDAKDNFISGGLGVDVINGRGGSDFLSSNGFDLLTGGSGQDEFRFILFGAADATITDLEFGEQIVLSSPAIGISYIGEDGFTGQGTGEVRRTFDGTDTILSLDLDGDGAEDGTITLEGGEYLFSVQGSSSTSIDLLAESASVIGTTGNDFLNGTAGNDVIFAFTGEDNVNAGDGDDLVNLDLSLAVDGQRSVDFVDGGDGYDTIRAFGTSGLPGLADRGADIPVAENFFYLDSNTEGVPFNTIFTTSVERFELIDRTTEDLLELALIGTALDDVIDFGSETFSSQATRSYVSTGAGDDTVIANRDVRLEAYLGSGNNTVIGSDQNDSIFGSSGADIMDAGLGDRDRLVYLSSDAGVMINLQAGTASGGYAQGDIISGFERVSGSNFGDILIGSDVNNRLDGNDGNDTLSGGAGEDTLRGGLGNDILTGGTGADGLNGGDGTDFALYSTSAAGVTVDLASGTASGGDAQGDTLSEIENLLGSAFNDTFFGDALGNVLQGGDGNDALIGRGGNDILQGGDGNDILRGGEGSDVVNGGAGTDFADYRDSAAGITIDLASGTASGGDAQGDILVSIERIAGSNQNDTIFGSAVGNLLQGGNGNDVLLGRAGNDILQGGSGNDALRGGTGADVLNGGTGQDFADYRDSAGAVVIDLASGTASGGDAQGDTLVSIERIAGSAQNDTIFGSAVANVLQGGVGNDVLLGRAGNDILQGGAGNDALRGGTGADVLNGGAGQDFADYRDSAGAVTIDLTSGTASGGDAQGDLLVSIERVAGTAQNDTIFGSAVANVLQGGNGNDALFGRDGNDVLQGGNGNDILRGGSGADVLNGGAGQDAVDYRDSTSGVEVDLFFNEGFLGDAQGDTYVSIERVSGSNFDDTLYGDDGANMLQGNGGNDELRGEDGDDILFGGAGDDALNGEEGNDVLWGGTGSDTFFAASGDDVIRDFGASDIINLQSFGISNRAELQAISQNVGGDLVITFFAGASLTVENTLLSDIADSQFEYNGGAAAEMPAATPISVQDVMHIMPEIAVTEAGLEWMAYDLM